LSGEEGGWEGRMSLFPFLFFIFPDFFDGPISHDISDDADVLDDAGVLSNVLTTNLSQISEP
jgi:hypothetical protein